MKARFPDVLPLLTSAALAVALTMPMATGCATRQSVDSLRAQVDELERENFQLRKDLTEARVRLERLREAGRQAEAPGAGSETSSLQAPRRDASRPAAPTPPAPATPQVIYSEPITDPAAVGVPHPGGSGSTRSSRPGRPEPVVPGAAGPGAAGPEDGARLMAEAKRSLDAKDPEGALERFRHIVSTRPQDAIADDAQFGVGECYFQMGRYEEAITEYRRVIDQYPFGDQVPYAFLKIGFARLAQERREEALDNFKTVSEAFPGTEAATVARQQIAHLRASTR